MKKNTVSLFIDLFIEDVIDYAFCPISASSDYFVEAGVKWNLDHKVGDLFLQEFTNVDDIYDLISKFDYVDATEPMTLEQFNYKLFFNKEFHDEVCDFLAEQFKENCKEKQLIVEENTGIELKKFRVIWYDDFYNEDWVDYSVYLRDVLTCFDVGN